MTATTDLALEVPAKPDVLNRLDQLFRSDDATVADVCAVIETDVATAAAVIQTANSPLFSFAAQFSSVRQAVNYLGMREVAGITRMVSLRRVFGSGPAFDALWSRSSRRAVAAARLAAYVEVAPDAAHTAGLFLHSGQLLMCAAKAYREVIEASLPAADRALLERRLFGCTALEATLLLGEKWGLGEGVLAAIEGDFTHIEGVRLRSVVDIADVLAQGSECLQAPLQAAYLGVPEATLIERAARVRTTLLAA